MASSGTDSTPSPFIRPYNPATDRDHVAHVCRETLPPELAHDARLAAIAPHIWALPYLTLYPDLCIVLDDGAGRPVGYILGAPSGRDYVARYHAEIVPTLDGNFASPASTSTDEAALMLRTLHAPDADVLHPAFPALLPAFPAHLHIDLLLPYRRYGWGARLMARFVALMERRGDVRGVHLVMGPHNVRTGAEAFYARVGFCRYAHVLDGGFSGEEGRFANGCVCMVRELDGSLGLS